MLNQDFQRRFDELEAKFLRIRFDKAPLPPGKEWLDLKDAWAEQGVWQEWAVSACHLVQAVFGKDSSHYSYLTKSFEKCNGSEAHVRELRGIFLSAKEDFEGGYVFDVDLRVSGEVFGDFVVMARQALATGNKEVAAVLACAALEDALKRFSAANGLAVDEKPMKEVINALKSKGLVSGSQKSLLDAMPKIRDAAMHARWDRIEEPEVSGVIGFVQQFLLANFSKN